MLGQQGANFAGCSREEIAFEVEPGQCATGELDSLGLNAVSPAVEVAQFLLHRPIVGGQFECPFHAPYGCVEFATPAVYFAHRSPREHVLRVSAEYAVKHVSGVLVLTGLNHGLAYQPVGRRVLGIVLQYVLPVGYGLHITALLNHALDLLTVFVKGNLSHCSHL